MRGILFTILIMLGLVFAPVLNQGDVLVIGAPNTAPMGMEDVIENQCLPVEILQDAGYAAELCSEWSNADCDCSLTDTGVKCALNKDINFDVKCDGGLCKTSMFGISDELSTEYMDSTMAGLLCETVFQTKCDCTGKPNNVECTVPVREVEISCEDNVCMMIVGKNSAPVPICGSEMNGLPKSDIEVPKPPEKKIDGFVFQVKIENKKPVMYVQEDSEQPRVRLRVNLKEVPRDIQMKVRKVSAVREDIKSKFKERMREHVINGTPKFLEVYEIEHPDLRNGDDIQSAELEFQIAKDKVNDPKSLVVFRYSEDGSAEVYVPTVTDMGDYYLLKINTSGLSLYAVATVEQISESAGGEEAAASSGCMAAGFIIFATLGLYVFGRE